MRFSALLALFGLTFGTAQAQTGPASDVVTSKQSITVRGRVLNYTARAGRLPIRDIETGEPHAWMFYTAYHLDRAANAPPRPITFLWNGGPGSSSSFVHLFGYGPRKVKTGDIYPDGPPPSKTELIDNQETWLEESDLIFVDPVGTGYSRTTKPEYGREFYQDKGDAESVAEFIRVYRQQFGLFDAPLILGGESYGVSRAGRVADVLQQRNVTVDGVILITYDLPVPTISLDVRRALALPTYTAAAHYHRKLPPDLQANLTEALAQAHKWSEEVYLPALARRDSLSEAERDQIIAQVARFTGLQPSQIDRRALAITSVQFSTQLLADRGLITGRYDSRFTEKAPPPGAGGRGGLGEVSLRPISGIDGGPLLAKYYRDEIGYRTDLSYGGVTGQSFSTPRVSWNSATNVAGGRAGGRGDPGAALARPGDAPAGTVAPLTRALNSNPDMRVFLICGYWDLGSNCIGDAHYGKLLGEPYVSRLWARNYFGMHAPYLDKLARVEMKRDFGTFVRQVTRR